MNDSNYEGFEPHDRIPTETLLEQVTNARDALDTLAESLQGYINALVVAEDGAFEADERVIDLEQQIEELRQQLHEAQQEAGRSNESLRQELAKKDGISASLQRRIDTIRKAVTA